MIIYILFTIIIYVYLTNKDTIKEYYEYNINFNNRMKEYLLWFYKEKYIDYEYLQYNSEILIFLYLNRHYESISPVIFRNLVIKTIKYLKYLKENNIKEDNQYLIDKRAELLNIFHSFIFSLGAEDLTDFNKNNMEFEKLLINEFKIQSNIYNTSIEELNNNKHMFYL